MRARVQYWLKRKLVGSKKDFDEFCWMIKPWRVNLAISAIIIRDRKILLVKPKNRTVFYPPGGLVERGEDLKKACIREVKEELGVRVKIIAPLSPTVRWNINEAKKKSNQRILVVFNYLAEITKGEAKIIRDDDPGGVEEYRWVTFDSLRELPILPEVKSIFKEGLDFVLNSGRVQAPTPGVS